MNIYFTLPVALNFKLKLFYEWQQYDNCTLYNFEIFRQLKKYSDLGKMTLGEMAIWERKG